MSPIFLFVHGFGCNQDSWQLQVDALSTAFDVVTLDLPGHGKSPLPEVHDLATLARAVDWTKNRCSRPVILVGHSMGCRVALEAFRMSHLGIAGLVFLDGSATGREHSQRLLELLRERLRLYGMSASLRTNFEEMFVASSPAYFRDATIATAMKLDHTFAENILANLARWDAVDALQLVADSSLPVLSIQSTTLGPDMKRRSLELGETSAWGELVRRSIHGVLTRDISGVGHFVHVEAADVVNEELAAFGRQCSNIRRNFNARPAIQ